MYVRWGTLRAAAAAALRRCIDVKPDADTAHGDRRGRSAPTRCDRGQPELLLAHHGDARCRADGSCFLSTLEHS
eukprot:1699279-Prymnesium_polylepis.4